MKKFGKIGKVISGLEFDKGVAAFIGALGALGSLIFAAISSARNLGEEANEPVENTDECELIQHNQAEAETQETTVEEPNEAPSSDEK